MVYQQYTFFHILNPLNITIQNIFLTLWWHIGINLHMVHQVIVKSFRWELFVQAIPGTTYGNYTYGTKLISIY